MTIDVRGLQFRSARFAAAADAIGTVVHVDGKVAIAATSIEPGASGQRILLAAFDPTTSGFKILPYDDRPVLVLDGDAILEPDLSVPSQIGTPNANSTSELYYNDGGIYIRLHVPAAPDQHPIMNLVTNKISTDPVQRAHVFKRWRLGVKKSKRVTWVLAIGAELGSWACDEMM